LIVFLLLRFCNFIDKSTKLLFQALTGMELLLIPVFAETLSENTVLGVQALWVDQTILKSGCGILRTNDYRVAV
jgi:hypothetical protein